jgi:hypothetical protein
MATAAAIIATIIFAALAVFQAALAAGAPLGRFAWGGRNEILPLAFRVASASVIPLYGLMMIMVLDRAGVTAVLPEDAARIGAWAIFAYLLLGIGVNAMSRSRPERMVMMPVTAVLALLTLIVAVS